MLSDDIMYIKGIEDEPLIDGSIISSTETQEFLKGMASPYMLIIKANPEYKRVVLRLKSGWIITIQRLISYDTLEEVTVTDIVGVIESMLKDMKGAVEEVLEDLTIVDKFVSMGESHTTRIIDRTADFAAFVDGEEK